jgi:hypothetical protein
MDNGARAGWESSVRQLLEDIEGQTAEAMEEFVAGEGFTEILTRVTENVVAMSKIRSDVGDLLLRNLRVAGQADINRLARQLSRTEDKLELLLQAVERLEDSGHRT